MLKSENIFLRAVDFFEKTDPLVLLHIENVHIVKFFGNFVDAAINDHEVIFVNACRVTRSWNRLVSTPYLSPFKRVKVKLPSIR